MSVFWYGARKCEKRNDAKNGTLLHVEFERQRNVRQEGL